MKYNLNLINSGTLATEIQVHVKISQFITLLLKQSDSLPIHREKVSMCTIGLVGYNLIITNGIYCAIEYIFENHENFLFLNILTPLTALVIYL